MAGWRDIVLLDAHTPTHTRVLPARAQEREREREGTIGALLEAGGRAAASARLRARAEQTREASAQSRNQIDAAPTRAVMHCASSSAAERQERDARHLQVMDLVRSGAVVFFSESEKFCEGNVICNAPVGNFDQFMRGVLGLKRASLLITCRCSTWWKCFRNVRFSEAAEARYS